MSQLKNVALFAGIAGLELGLQRAGHETILFCESDPAPQAVLRHRFPDVPIVDDVASMASLPECDLVAAGFPCSDLSQAGPTRGIEGANSGLVGHVFRLVDRTRRKPRWLLLENVPFMLRLQSGRAMNYLTKSLEDLGYTWAYRIIDTRAFGIPQRRRRVILLASRSDDPREIILADDAGRQRYFTGPSSLCGFYWTEGNTGLGWAVNAVPTLKGGSSLGIPSPPGVAVRGKGIGVPDIRDAERLQGFSPYWTSPAEWVTGRRGVRWRLIGNAVTVSLSRWVGRRLAHPRPFIFLSEPLDNGEAWPIAAWGTKGRAFRVDLSEFPVVHKYKTLRNFLEFPLRPLSLKATTGFRTRLEATSLNLPPGFLELVRFHEGQMAEWDLSQPLLDPTH